MSKLPKQVAVSLPDDLSAAVERWRLSAAVPPSRSAALAALIAAGMRALAPDYLGGGSGAPDADPPSASYVKGG